ncbi:MAG: effector binding domain-containing protein [Saprospiraceae bacterium]|nr:effector binding domain-containing protein [Saprospiraceae bacterium]MCB9321969.1 effector binding domain-containing protein [Lewinellaceae bacterium]
MKSIERPKALLAGIQVRTINRNGQSLKDLGVLWKAFYEQQIQQQVPQRINDEIWVVYHDYASDHRDFYTAFIGCPVKDPSGLPENLLSLEVPAGAYLPRAVQGHMPQALLAEWELIWNNEPNLNRAYGHDVEIHTTVPAEDLACWIYLSVHRGKEQ